MGMLRHRRHRDRFIRFLLFGISVCSYCDTKPAWSQQDLESNTSTSDKLRDDDEDSKAEFDKLLQLAEHDVGQLSSVRVSTTAPSLDIEVSSVSRSPSTVGKTPAAVFVISNEMIRRSGATNVPEALRMAPGVNVARIDANKWAVSIRGFNNRFANKLLVQVDGRTVYSPLFAGVLWDAQEIMLEDVDRIEVIRGPGASVWGANAVNGVINIITKRSQDTQGLFAQAGAGTFERGFTNLRYGGKIGDTGIHYRTYGKWFERGTGTTIDPSAPAADDWRFANGGFRTDWDVGGIGQDFLMVEGDHYSGVTGGSNLIPTLAPPYSNTLANDSPYNGSNLVARWTRKLDEDREWQIQTYYSDTERNVPVIGFFENRNTYDIDAQYRFAVGDRHKVVCGSAFRSTSDQLPSGSFPTGWRTDRQRVDMASVFLQDEISLVENRWSLTLGSKFFEHSYVGFDYQPTARLLFTPDDRRSMWGSVSRAVRVPSRAENSMQLYSTPIVTNPFPVYKELIGNDNLKSEQLLAWELGYRAQPLEYFSWDAATFYNQYNSLIQFPPSSLGLSPYGVVLPLQGGNLARAQTYGFELATTLDMRENWKIRSAYTYLSIFMNQSGVAVNEEEGQSPQNQMYVQSSWTLNKQVDIDVIGRYVDSLPSFGISSYCVSDLRIAWKPRKEVEWFMVGRGLFDAGHSEFGPDVGVGGLPTGVRSELYAGVSIRR